MRPLLSNFKGNLRRKPGKNCVENRIRRLQWNQGVAAGEANADPIVTGAAIHFNRQGLA
jgi:hypothetical protein